jgi:cytochrome c peroxidase
MKKWLVGLVFSGVLYGCGSDNTVDSNHDMLIVPPTLSSKALLGAELYADVNLSFNRSQSCATCHNPDHGFIDERTNDASMGSTASAGSLGDNGTSIGDRNAPTAAYAAFSPEFFHGSRERAVSQAGIANYVGFLGGQFWDGREDDLAGQAGGPPTNPNEMGMPDKASVVNRIQENSEYIAAFEYLYGADIFNDADAAYIAMAHSIGEFEKTAEFSPFDSKYDRSLTGDYVYPIFSKARLGKALFFSSDFSCASCHQLRPLSNKQETFTSFEYHNIGVPENVSLRTLNLAVGPDNGLLNNPKVTDITHKGKFKVPTLRNVAVSAPYMHNGVFQTLETVLHFYEHAKFRALNLDNSALVDTIENPESGQLFAAAEIAENIEHGLLGGNDKPLNLDNIEAMVCFFMSLTDERYEPLLDANKVALCDL